MNAIKLLNLLKYYQGIEEACKGKTKSLGSKITQEKNRKNEESAKRNTASILSTNQYWFFTSGKLTRQK